MDITKEIADIKARQGNANIVVSNLQEQKIEIDKQIYIVSVVAVACAIQDMIKAGEFSQHNIDKLLLTDVDDHDYGNVIKYKFKDKDNNNIKKSLVMLDELTNKLDEIFDAISGFDYDQISEQFKETDSILFNLSEPFEEKFIDLMLSKELKAILEHGELQNSMSTNEVVPKKPKM